MWLNKRPSVISRVLDADDCPPHDVIHDINDYPKFYDALYYPQWYPQFFLSPNKCSMWLERCLNEHVSKCYNCKSEHVVQVQIVSDEFRVMRNDGNICNLSILALESALYSHCSLFAEFAKISRSRNTIMDGQTRMWLMNENPRWMVLGEEIYMANLIDLPATVLSKASNGCIRYVKNPRMHRNKQAYTYNILSSFISQRQSFIVMDDDAFSAWSHANGLAYPDKSRNYCFSMYFVALYGEMVTSMLRALPFKSALVPDVSRILKIFGEDFWLSDCPDTLIENIEKGFKPNVLIGTLRNIPNFRRPVYDTKSRRKTANILVNHILCRAAYLCTLSEIELYEHVLSLSPSLDTFSLPVSDLLETILVAEYGNEIISALKTSSASRKIANKEARNVKLKEDRRVGRLKQVDESRIAEKKIEDEWPAMIPQETILECLKAYRDGTIWKELPICAVCAQYSENSSEFKIGQDDTEVPGLNLGCLEIKDEFIVQQCIIKCNSAEFVYENAALDGLMLEKKGIRTVDDKTSLLTVCTECQAALRKSNIPRFALANKLYRGNLPIQFQDMTWVEEMACSIYRNTAHITRLYGSSDTAQPTVLHGNTCAHDMNTVSTAKVLPRTPTDINDILTIVFIGPGKLKLESLKNMFRIRKSKVWDFLLWLKNHNRLYMDIPFDENIMNMYPDDDVLPGLDLKIIQDDEQDPGLVFNEETAGFMDHPAHEFREGKPEDNDDIMLEKMGVSDPESDKISGRTFTSTALRNLVKDLDYSSELPDLVVHHGGPVCEYNNPDLLPGMFPTLFPYGIGGFDDKTRPTGLSFQQQSQYYFNITNRSFRYHYAYIFVALNIWQRRTSHLHTSFTVNASKFDSIAKRLIQVSSSTLSSLATALENEHSLTNLTAEEKMAFDLLKHTNSISARIPGSQASKIFIRNEIRNYFAYFGLPHIYFTFNPSAAHSPIFQVFFGDKSVDLSERFPQLVPSRERALRLAKDPVAAADFFEFCVRAVFKYLFGWDYDKNKSSEKGGILGKLRAFYGTSEFTERGSLHGHFLIWLVGGMNPSDLHDRLRNDPTYEKKFFAFFESIIHHHLPDVDVSIDSSYEPRIQRPPIPPTLDDINKNPLEILEEWETVYATEVKMCGEVLQRHTCRAVCHKYGNNGKCRFLFPHEVVQASFFDSDTNSVVLVCRDATINYFNPYILIFCRHNHDIKCILSGHGAKAAMFYITDYITKMDLKTYQSLSLLSRAVAKMPEISELPPTEAARTLLHKCLSQFTRQQQIHAQQAVRYLQGHGDGISSHKTVPMMSTLLLSFVKHSYEQNKNKPEVHEINIEDEEIEPTPLKIQVDTVGRLVEAHQVHHYWYRADALSDMSFFEFCRCVRLEPKSKSNRLKNNSETRLGVLKRHCLKAPHPLACTHWLVEHTNAERGDLRTELVPRVVGMSIPRNNSPIWPLFALAHHKPFSLSNPLIEPLSDWSSTYNKYKFTESAKKIMKNWNAIHECEDERDADRLRKRDAATHESKSLTAAIYNSMVKTDEDEEHNFNDSIEGEKLLKYDFAFQELLSTLQQSKWLNPAVAEQSKLTNSSTGLMPRPTEFVNKMKEWMNEVKLQENIICQARRNAVVTSQSMILPSTISAAQETEYGIKLLNLAKEPVDTEAPNIDPEGTHDRFSKIITPLSIMSTVETKFNLNIQQSRAFRIIAQNYVDRCVDGKKDIKPLRMLMTGPGGTGKTHVVKAVKEFMGHFGSAHKIRFLAPTGSAACLIDGMTIHKGLGIKIVSSERQGKGRRNVGDSHDDMSLLVSVQNKTNIREEWQNVEVALIDECSMLGEDLLCESDQALRFAKEVPGEWFCYDSTFFFSFSFLEYTFHNAQQAAH